MKKTFLIAVFAIGIFSGCAKNEINQVDKNNQPITYQTVMGKVETKAAPYSGTLYPETYSFGSAAFLTDGAWADSYRTAGVYIEKSKVSFKDNGWSTDKTYFWPMDGVNLTFFSVSPWESFAETAAVTIDKYNGVVINDWDVSENQDIDIMVADIAADQVDNTESINKWQAGVPTVFRHKLAQIVKFSVKTTENLLDNQQNPVHVYINKIALKNIHYKGTYYSGNNVDGSPESNSLGEWVKTNDKQDYLPLVISGEGINGQEITDQPVNFEVSYNKSDGAELQNYLLVLPQDFPLSGGPQIEVTYTYQQRSKVETKTVAADLYAVHNDSHAWEMNKIYTYNLAIEIQDNIHVYWAPSVYDWTDQTLGEYIMQ